VAQKPGLRKTDAESLDIRIRIHPLLPGHVGAENQAPVAVFRRHRVEGDGRRAVLDGVRARVIGGLTPRPGAFQKPFGGADGAEGGVSAGSVQAGCGCAHFGFG